MVVEFVHQPELVPCVDLLDTIKIPSVETFIATGIVIVE